MKSDINKAEKKKQLGRPQKAIDEKVQKYKYTDAYAYHPQNMNKGYPHRIGENVDMVIW